MHPHAVHNWLHCYRSVCGCGRVQNNVHVRQQAPYAMSCNSPCSSSSHKNCVLQNTAQRAVFPTFQIQASLTNARVISSIQLTTKVHQTWSNRGEIRLKPQGGFPVQIHPVVGVASALGWCHRLAGVLGHHKRSASARISAHSKKAVKLCNIIILCCFLMYR